MPDNSQRTEKPTQRKLQKARQEGRFPTSKEFVAGVQFLAFVYVFLTFSDQWLERMRSTMRFFLLAAFRENITSMQLLASVHTILWSNIGFLSLLALVLMGSTLATQVAITGLGFSVEKLAPDWKRLNPLQRLKQLPANNIPAVIQAAVMLPIFGLAVFLIVQDNYSEFLSLPLGSMQSGASRVAATLANLLWKAAFALLLFGTVDLFRQRRKHAGEMRMSKQDIKDEHKESDGNPQIKMKIRRLQRDLLRRNMMKAIPTATAVIVNPTHYAVAIKYQVDSMAAPIVVAKGRNYLALRIRKRAIEHQVPIVENVPLAQALYNSADIGQEIPAHLYRAVAEILAYIFRLMHGAAPRHT
ncbi:MAG TPA: EscU/YscU/HrcU family type III secretion system export apparatus switch protein [Bryobacteraceae bacterium]|nr:EscU/YscU/HrcU family type III secretion system export apparatus switch protein [Bryobacteraceae bacterium]